MFHARRRQTVLLTSFMTPDMNALLGGPLCANHAGKLRVAPHHTGVLGQVVPQVRDSGLVYCGAADVRRLVALAEASLHRPVLCLPSNHKLRWYNICVCALGTWYHTRPLWLLWLSTLSLHVVYLPRLWPAGAAGV